MNLGYLIETKMEEKNPEFQLTITDGFSALTYMTDWTCDRIEMYHDAISFLNSLIKSAEDVKERILNNIKETVDEMA